MLDIITYHNTDILSGRLCCIWKITWVHESFLTSSLCDGGPPRSWFPGRVEYSIVPTARRNDAAMHMAERQSRVIQDITTLFLIFSISSSVFTIPASDRSSRRNDDWRRTEIWARVATITLTASGDLFSRYASMPDWLSPPRLCACPSPNEQLLNGNLGFGHLT